MPFGKCIQEPRSGKRRASSAQIRRERTSLTRGREHEDQLRRCADYHLPLIECGGGVNCGSHSVRVGPEVDCEREVVVEMKRRMTDQEREAQAPCGCVEDVIDYAGLDLPITRRCNVHEAERKAQQREDALAWARMNGQNRNGSL